MTLVAPGEGKQGIFGKGRGETEFQTPVPASCTVMEKYGAFLVSNTTGKVISCYQPAGMAAPNGLSACPYNNDIPRSRSESNYVVGPGGSFWVFPPILYSHDKTWLVVVESGFLKGTPPDVQAHVVYAWKAARAAP